MSWSDWLIVEAWSEATIAFNSCYAFDPPGDCGSPPVVVQLPLGEPDGTNTVVTIKIGYWDAYMTYVDSARTWGSCVTTYCPNGVCR